MRLILFCFLLWLQIPVFAQSKYLFQHLTVEDGLMPAAKVSTFQDSEGYYWFASATALQRFDGKDFITYKYNFKNKRAYETNWSVKPIEDKEKNIWVRGSEGILILKRNERRLERLYMGDAADSNYSNVCNVFKDAKKNMWIISSRNIFRYDYTSGKPVFVETMDEDFRHTVYDKRRNGFWIILDKLPHEMVYFDCNLQKFRKVPDVNLLNLFGHDNPISLFKIDADNNLWISNYIGDLCMYNPDNGKIIYYNILHNRHKGKTNLPNSAVFDLTDDGNAIWFTSDFYTGIIRFDKRMHSFSFIQKDNGSEYGLHYESEGYDIFLDNEKNIWVNTDMGMNIFNPGMHQFRYLNIKTDTSVSDFSSNITSFFESSNKEIWITTWGAGVFRFDSNFNLIRHYTNQKNNIYSLGEPLNKTWSVAEDSRGRIWVGCQYAMLSVLNTSTGQFKNKYVPEFEKKTIMSIAKDKRNNFWFGLHSGFLGKWDVESDKFFLYKNLYKNEEKNNHAIDGLCVDNANNIWVSTGNDRLIRFDPDMKDVAETAFAGVHVLSFSIVNDSLIIGGSLGQGLFIYNMKTKGKRFFNTDQGLSSNVVYGVLAHNEHDLWILTNEGIERLDMVSWKFTKYGIEDGIKDFSFDRAFYKLQNGAMLIAANSGIICFNPDNISQKIPPKNVSITAIRISQNDISVDSVMQLGRLYLVHTQNSIAIDFGSLSFIGRKNFEYYYKLDGADKDWVAAGKQRSVMYANLNPGKYVFKVKSRNRDGIESAGITALIIVVSSAWWQTWWTYSLWAILTVLIIYFVYNYRKANKAELSKMRQKIASDLHDDIGSTLNSISVYSEIAGRQLKENTAATKDLLDKIGIVSRNMIDNMNDIVWAISPKNDHFEKIIQRMQYFAGEILSGKNILLQFSIDEKVKGINLAMEKRKNFYLIFKEAINNTYKYSMCRTVNVVLAFEQEKLIMIITDDGCGFDAEQKNNRGNGLRNMNDRAKEIGATLLIKSWQAKGTRLELSLPFK
ncbi:MAG TPA: two-component regulator propeller domain-containing protein [Puia sp.]|nr:two-component regulator propeller domain-containing protein [Puia sp.]